MHVLRPHQYSPTCESLETIGNKRARELISRNQPIKFFWSGGIDSTFALNYILTNLTNSDQLTVYHTCESLIENPDYLTYIESHNVKLGLWSDLWETPFDKNDLVITCSGGDNITASVDESFYQEHSEWLYRPWQDYFKFRGIDFSTIEQIEQKFSQHDNSITTTLEARWWFYYIIRHQYWITRDWNINLENGIGQNVVCFFDCYEFDAWSQVNRNQMFGGRTWNTYKQVFKDNIYRFWPNENFRKNKTKEDSKYSSTWILKKTAQFNQQYLFLYLDKNNQAQAFRPRQWPLLNRASIINDLIELGYEV